MPEQNFDLNGRFLTRPLTGVDRFAYEMARALQVEQIGLRAIVPERSSITAFAYGDIAKRGRLRGQLWEQISLRYAAGDNWLLNFGNTAPILRKKQLIAVHDAQIYTQAASYSAAFRLWYRVMQPLAAKSAQHVITVSNHSKAELERFGVVQPGRTHVVYNGADHILRPTVDSETLARYGLRRKNYILAIGSLAKHKNLKVLIAAFEAAGKALPELIICGGGNAKVFAQNGFPTSERVRFLGYVSDGELRALYENATALAFPSRAEGFGLPPVEAMLCGCPVVATTAGAVPEICGDAALYCDPNDPIQWCDTLSKLVSDPDQQSTRTALGYQRAARYTWANSAKQMLSLFKETNMS